MPDSGFLFMSLASIVVGALLFLSPQTLFKLSHGLNRTLAVLDERMVRYRYVVGLAAFIAGYAFFQLALMLPALRG